MCHQQTGKYECKQTQVPVLVCVSVFVFVSVSVSVWVCVCVCICIKSNFNCAYLSLGKYLQRSLATAFDWNSVSSASETGQNALATKEFKANTHTQTHPQCSNKHYEPTGNRQINKQTAKKIQLFIRPPKKKNMYVQVALS